MWVLCLFLVLIFSNVCTSSGAISLMGEESERAGWFTLIVFLIRDCYGSVACPHSAVG